jgi:cation diffusion facilitator CzcD-associated flavoprotein CzcO
MASGETIDCDIIVTATGLNMKLLGGIELAVDGEQVRTSDLLIYKGMMLSGVPNLFIAFGYTNASWTLRSDLTARSMCRLINRMKRDGHDVCTPRADPAVERRPVMDLVSGYVKRSEAMLPKQGSRPPWRVPQNYVRDLAAMTFRRIDEALEFRKAAS